MPRDRKWRSVAALLPEDFPPTDTTNALESVHPRISKFISTRGHFGNDDGATKRNWLALCNVTAKWRRITGRPP